MSIKFCLVVMNFLQFFVWGLWLIIIGVYWFQNCYWGGVQFGVIFFIMGIVLIFMFLLMGVVVDKWINVEKFYGLLYIFGVIVLCIVLMIDWFGVLFWVMLVNMCCYMFIIVFFYVVVYNVFKCDGLDVVIIFLLICVWGMVGFIVVLWMVSLLKLEIIMGQFYVVVVVVFVFGLYVFSLLLCLFKLECIVFSGLLLDMLGLILFRLFKNVKMVIFFIFVMLFGVVL